MSNKLGDHTGLRFKFVHINGKDSVLPSQLLEAKKSSRKISPVGASRDFDAPNNSLSPTNQLEPLTRLFC